MAQAQRVMHGLGAIGERAGRKLRSAFERAAKGAAAFREKIGGLGSAILSVGVGALTQRIIGQAAEFQQTQVRLEALSKEYGEFDRIQQLVAQNAKTFNQSLGESASNFSDAYARLRPLGVSLEQIQTVYEGFNATALASGTSAAAASGAFLQLSQALGSGRLQGDEFRSIAEQVPGILRLVAKEMNVTVGELKELGSEGKITSDILINALAKGFEENKDKIEELLAKSPAQQFKAFQNAVSGLSNTIGSELLPVAVPMVKQLTEIVKAFGALPGPVKTTTAALLALGAAATFAIGPLGTLVTIFGAPALIAAAPFVAAAAGLTALGVAAVQGTQKVQRYNDIVEITGNTVAELDKEAKEVQDEIKGLQTELDRGGRRAVIAKKKVKELQEALEKIEGRRKIIIDLEFDVPFPNFDKMGPGFQEKLDELLGKKKPLTEEQRKAAEKAETKRMQAMQARINGAQRALAAEAAVKGEIEQQGILLDEALKASGRLVELAEAQTETEREEIALKHQIQDLEEQFKDNGAALLIQDAERIFNVNRLRREQEEAAEAQKEATRELDALYGQIGQTISDTIVGSITNAQSATEALGDSLRNIGNQILRLGINTGLQALFPGSSLFSSLPAFANGGRPPVGRASIVGERGPELFVPSTAGTIIPNYAMGGANVVVNVDASGTQAQGNQPNAKALGAAIGAAVQAELVKQKRPGGLLS